MSLNVNEERGVCSAHQYLVEDIKEIKENLNNLSEKHNKTNIELELLKRDKVSREEMESIRITISALETSNKNIEKSLSSLNDTTLSLKEMFNVISSVDKRMTTVEEMIKNNFWIQIGSIYKKFKEQIKIQKDKSKFWKFVITLIQFIMLFLFMYGFISFASGRESAESLKDSLIDLFNMFIGASGLVMLSA